jgi:hypothetical protein
MLQRDLPLQDYDVEYPISINELHAWKNFFLSLRFFNLFRGYVHKYSYISGVYPAEYKMNEILSSLSGPDGYVSPYHELVPTSYRYLSPYHESGVHKHPFPKVYKQH